MLIREDGNVGIGTSSPGAPLEVTGGDISPTVILGRTGGLPTIQSAAGDDLWLDSNGNSLDLNTTSGGDVYLVNGGGTVGIGSINSYGYKLFCAGSAAKIGGGSWTNPSDKNLKDINGNFNHGINELLQLSPVVYNYKTNNELNLPSDQEYIGLIAQEVQKVIPEAVEIMESGYLAVNNDPIIWTMLNAIKEQQKEIEKLKEIINKLND